MKHETSVEVNVEEIMQEIRRKARMAEEMSALPAFESIPFRDEKKGQPVVAVSSGQMNWAEYLENLDYVNRNYDIPYYWSFGSNSSIKVFLKRVVRKLAKCIIPPILARQNEMNAHFVRCLNQLRWVAEEGMESNRVLSQELTQLKQSSAEREQALLAEMEQQKKQMDDLFEQQKEYLNRELQKQIEVLNQTAERQGQLLQYAIEGQKKELECIDLRYQERFQEQAWKMQRYEEQNQAMETVQREISERLSMETKETLRISELMKKLPIKTEPSAADRDTRLEWQFTSQAGEDMIITYILIMLGVDTDKISYLDLGANHAKFLSNTYYFYQKGARGVLVEANPALIGELKFYRNEDIILNRCVSTESGETVDFYVLNGDGLSTPDREQAEEALRINPTLQLERVVQVETITPNEILEQYFDGAPTFMNVDIEGKDLEILKSIDFEAHRPLVISVEMIPYRTHLVVGEKNQDVLDWMAEKDYIEYAFTGINSIFIDKRKLRR